MIIKGIHHLSSLKLGETAVKEVAYSGQQVWPGGPFLSVSPSALTIPADGTPQTITVIASEPWEVI